MISLGHIQYTMMFMVYTMYIYLCRRVPVKVPVYTLYIHGIYHEHHSISKVSLADHDAIVYEWYKSLNFQYTFNVQRCPDDLEFLGGYAYRVISI